MCTISHDSSESWGIFTSLYSTLSRTEVTYLEAAIRARCSGRLAFALSIFENKLSANSEIPLLVIEKVSLLQWMGREHECAVSCRRALELLRSTQAPESSVFHCLSLLQGLSDFHAHGKLSQALERARSFEKWIRAKAMEDYVDIEVHCIHLYYRILDLCRDLSNYVQDESHHALPGNIGGSSAGAKLTAFRQHLQGHGRLKEAGMLLRIEMIVQGKPYKLQGYSEWIKLAEMNQTQGGTPLAVKLADVKLEYAEELIEQGSVPEGEVQAIEARRIIIIASTNGDWEKQFPRFHLRYCISKTRLSSSGPPLAMTIKWLTLASRSAALSDIRTQRICLLSATDIVTFRNSSTGAQSQNSVTHDVTMNVLFERIEFESNITKEAFYLTGALGRFGYYTVIKERSKPGEFLNLFEKLRRNHPHFDVPNMTNNLASIATNAATQIGDIHAEGVYRELEKSELPKCSFTRFFQDDLPVYLDERNFHRNWDPDGRADYWRYFEKSSAALVCNWVKQDFVQGIISNEDCKTILVMGTEESLERVFQDVSLLEISKALYETVFGAEDPSSSSIWDPWWKATGIWLQREDAGQYALRLDLLVKISQCRRDHMTNLVARIDFSLRKSIIHMVVESRQNNLTTLQLVQTLMPSAVMTDTVMDAKLMVFNATQILSDLPGVKDEGLLTDQMLEESFNGLQECLDYYRKNNRLENAVRTLHWLGQCCWSRHFYFNTIPVTATFPFIDEAEKIYRQIRMENFILKGSRSYLARHTLSETLQIGIMTALSVRYSFRALVQRLMNRAGNMPEDFTAQRLSKNMVDWIQRSKAQALSDILGLETNPPAQIILDAKKKKHAFRLVRKEISLIEKLDRASIPVQISIRADIATLRNEMRKEPSLFPLLNIREGMSASAEEIKAMSTDFGPDVVLVDWVYILFLDEWDLLLVTYRNGDMNKLINLPLKLDYVEKWTETQLQVDDPFLQRNADYYLHRLDPLVAPLAELTAPGETLVFCPTKTLHRVPLHALCIGDQIAIERNPIIYCHSLSVLRLCHMQVKAAMEAPAQPFKATVFSPLPESPELCQGLSEIAGILGTDVILSSTTPKSSFLLAATNSSLIHFHGHSQLGESSPLRQHLDFTGIATAEALKETEDMLTADEIFDISLRRPTHITIMACSSARAKVSDCDDLLGLTTALYCAGASSVVSALWPLGSKEGLLFSKTFYENLMEEMNSSEAMKTVNMAKAMQSAVLTLMKHDGHVRKPYHWAGLVFSGFWLFRIK